MSFRQGLLRVAVAMPLLSASVQADLSQFRGSLNGWSPQWDCWNMSPAIAGQASLVSNLGYDDLQSLRFNMGTGAADDGTLWIEKSYVIPAGVPTNVDISFYLYSPQFSELNQFQVKAYIAEANPQSQWDFDYLGTTDQVAGWHPYTYTESVTSATGTVWVGLGIRVSHEVARVYGIDQVQVTAAPEPGTLGLLGLVGPWLLGRRRRSLPRS
jgi:hypothetical protein